MFHFNEFMENKVILESKEEDIQNLNNSENQDFYRYQVKFKLDTENLIQNENKYFYDYCVPISVDKIDDIEIKNIEYAELFINDVYCCQVDNDLEIIPSATYSDFKIRLYFTIYDPKTITLKFNAYIFPFKFKRQILSIPFTTNTHIYVDGIMNDRY